MIDLKVRFYVEDTEATEKLKEERKAEREANKDDEDFVQGVIQPVAQQGKEWFVTEGVEWTYEDNMTACSSSRNVGESNRCHS